MAHISDTVTRVCVCSAHHSTLGVPCPAQHPCTALADCDAEQRSAQVFCEWPAMLEAHSRDRNDYNALHLGCNSMHDVRDRQVTSCPPVAPARVPLDPALITAITRDNHAASARGIVAHAWTNKPGSDAGCGGGDGAPPCSSRLHCPSLLSRAMPS